VAAQQKPVHYDWLAKKVAQTYSTTAIHAAVLSDGKGNQRGLKLLQRVPGRDRRSKCLVASRTGRGVARLLASSIDARLLTSSIDGTQTLDNSNELLQIPHFLETRIIPTVRLALHAAPDINMTAFCVFLYIAQNNERFGHYGDPASIISQALKITNLPRNLEKLATDLGRSPGLGLIEIKKSSQDRRIILPQLTDTGLTLVANLAATVLGQAPSMVRQPKTESLNRASSPEDVKYFSDEDFDFIEIDEITWSEIDWSPDANDIKDVM
jgi:DNA-binding MarR family transcriptional regulator